MFQRAREAALEASQQKRREGAQQLAAATAEQVGKVSEQAVAEQMDVGILHAFLEGASWADAFDSYFIGFCPEFAAFVVGQEYTLQQTDIHINFITSAENLLDKQLGAMAITADKFLQQCLSDVKAAPPGSAAGRAAQAVMDRLEECADFERFGTMMRRRYESIQAAGGSVDEDDEDDDDLPSQPEQEPEPESEPHAEFSAEEAAFMREQEQIRVARERRKQAREEAVARAAAAAEEIDVFDAQPEPEPEPEPAPELEPEPKPEQQPSKIPTAGALESWEDGSDFAPPPKWELGTVHRGVVSFWENMPGVGGYGMILKMGKPEIVRDTHCTTRVGSVHQLALTSY
jgi:hypothetical protein